MNETAVPSDSLVSVFSTLVGTNTVSTSSTSSFQGSWRQSSLSPSWPVRRYDVTVGTIVGPGDGIYNTATDQIWQELGQINSTVVTLQTGQSLIARTAYALYVRAWWSGSRYTIFRSNNVVVDVWPPALSKRQRVADVVPWILGDADFTNSTSELQLSWQGSFQDSQSDIAYYEHGYGTAREGEYRTENDRMPLGIVN